MLGPSVVLGIGGTSVTAVRIVVTCGTSVKTGGIVVTCGTSVVNGDGGVVDGGLAEVG